MRIPRRQDAFLVGYSGNFCIKMGILCPSSTKNNKSTPMVSTVLFYLKKAAHHAGGTLCILSSILSAFRRNVKKLLQIFVNIPHDPGFACQALDFRPPPGYNKNNFILLKAVRRTNGCRNPIPERAALWCKRPVAGPACLPPPSAGANPRRAASRYQRDERHRKVQSGWNRGVLQASSLSGRGGAFYFAPMRAIGSGRRGLL